MDKTILVIDDEEMNLMMAEFILSKAGYRVLKAGSGQSGIEILQQEKVDLTLLDIEMPQMNGIQTLEAIRQDETICGSKVMVLAATIDDAVKEKMNGLGAAGYIGKPFLPADLLAQIECAV